MDRCFRAENQGNGVRTASDRDDAIPARTTRCLPLVLSALLGLVACAGGGADRRPVAAPDLQGALRSQPDLKALTAALEATGVAASLRTDRGYTIFAPTDQAVADRAAGPAGRLLGAAAVRHHILPVRLTLIDLAGARRRHRTLNGDWILVDARGTLAVGNARMIASDLTAGNGVIHVIDRVLAPAATPGDDARR